MTRLLRRLVYRVHFVLGSLLGGLWFFFLSGFFFVFALVTRSRSTVPYAAWLFGGVMKRVLGWRIDVEHPERLAHTEPVLWMGNHQSNLDTVLIAEVMPRNTVFFAKKELLNLPLFGWFLRATGQVVIDRKNLKSAIASIASAVERIRRERLSVWVFPEGHRNLAPEMLPFKKGGFHLALAAGTPIVPIVFSPIWTVLDARRWMVRPGRLRIRVLPPIPVTGRDPEDVDGLAADVRAAIETHRRDLKESAGPRID